MKKTFLLILLVFIFGCAQANDFNYGLKQISSLNSKYNTTIETYPKTLDGISQMASEYDGLRKMQLESGQEPFNYLIDYRLLNLEAEKLFMQGQKYGNSGTTKYGFGCKIRPLIIESAELRNKSSNKGFEAVNILNDFVKKYPEESKTAGLAAKNALFLNASFYQVFRDARRDSSIINNFCPANVTLELYREEFRKSTNFTQDILDKLTYEEAAQIWKISRGLK
ncbi:hypothetical protein HYX08_02425 [Candidatus Woesearchaeota archaeon]|nr:hypothetical protein [Candidatus Woesearchaeota archaeon]